MESFAQTSWVIMKETLSEQLRWRTLFSFHFRHKNEEHHWSLRVFLNQKVFVVLKHGAYYGGFTSAYNVGEDANFADYSWVAASSFPPKSKEL